MKNIVFGILVFIISMPAFSGTLFFLNNQSNGSIEFTDDVCPQDARFKRVFGFSNEGVILHGCYTIEGSTGKIFALWEGEVQREYHISDMKLTRYFYSEYGN